MPRISSGRETTQGGPVVLKETGKGGMRKIRCPACQGNAVPQKRSNGKVVNHCVTCKRDFGTTPM